METLHQILIDSVSNGLWNFVGYWIILSLIIYAPINLIKYLVNRPLRHKTIMEHGWPPKHCNADGDFKKKKKDEDEDDDFQ